jgi:hypothetical protein
MFSPSPDAQLCRRWLWMKKIRFKSMSLINADVLRASLRGELLAQYEEIKEMGGYVIINEAWLLAGGRVKVRGKVQLDEGGFHHFSRVIDRTAPR